MVDQHRRPARLVGLVTGIVYGVAMACLVWPWSSTLRAAIGADGTDLFHRPLPRRDAVRLDRGGARGGDAGHDRGGGRIAGRSAHERLAWGAVIFGVWDIGYYAWLWVFSGWPPSVHTWDLLFLIPAPWAGPVWAPIVVSAALIGFGLACAGRLRAGGSVRFGRRHLGALLAGGAIVIVSFLLNAGLVLSGGTPVDFAWPIFAAGMAIGVIAAWTALRN